MTGAPADQARPFSEVIESIGERPGETLCLGEVVETFGQQAFGPVMFFFALVNMMPWPPGGTTLTGAPLLLLSVELAMGRDELWAPRWAERVSIKRPLFRKFNGRLKRGLKLTERLSRPRLHLFTGQVGRVLIGLACTFLSIVLVLPVWGANLLPAVAVGFFSLGVTQRDGLAVIIGWLLTGATVAVLFLAWRVIVASVTHGVDWLARIA
ncbi:exopolysaccharide biosynthesis protein [Brevundimonas sp. LjRoot202]|uniref:exopolysaccharide biosynthesis protein n=1 Tax=Brevundimonas sp. LjRoot202 TaxID=3342281 RepID=UPI003ECDBB87